MKRPGIAYGAAQLLLAIALLLGGTAAGAAGGASPAVERSALSAEDRAAVLDRMREAVRAGIPAEDVEVIVVRGLERGAGASAITGFLDAALGAMRQDLPVRPVLDRIEQGLSKGIPPERIDAAARRLADGLAKARPLVDGLVADGLKPGPRGARDAAIESAARAGELAVPDRELLAAGRTAREQGRTLEHFDRAVRAMTSLAGTGMPPETAGRLVRTGIERGYGERDFGKLERRVSELAAQGRSMDEIAGTVERELRDARDAGGRREGGGRDRGAGTDRDRGSHGGRGR